MNDIKQKLTLDRPAIYQIKWPGVLDERWSDWAVNFNKRQNLKELIKVQKGIDELLNDDLSFEHQELNEWRNEASDIHEISIKTTEKISPAAGALIRVTDGVKSGNPKDIVIPILNQTNERIWVILKANL